MVYFYQLFTSTCLLSMLLYLCSKMVEPGREMILFLVVNQIKRRNRRGPFLLCSVVGKYKAQWGTSLDNFSDQKIFRKCYNWNPNVYWCLSPKTKHVQTFSRSNLFVLRGKHSLGSQYSRRMYLSWNFRIIMKTGHTAQLIRDTRTHSWHLLVGNVREPTLYKTVVPVVPISDTLSIIKHEDNSIIRSLRVSTAPRWRRGESTLELLPIWLIPTTMEP